jgi:hypothetical protein
MYSKEINSCSNTEKISYNFMILWNSSNFELPNINGKTILWAIADKILNKNTQFVSDSVRPAAYLPYFGKLSYTIISISYRKHKGDQYGCMQPWLLFIGSVAIICHSTLPKWQPKAQLSWHSHR